jgi:serine phosphatase RsbU (regulator of sigma subunit)
MALLGDDLLALSEHQARRQHLVALAHRRVRLLLPLVAVVAAVLVVVAIAQRHPVLRLAALAQVALAVGGYLALQRSPPPRRTLALVAAVLVAQAAVLSWIASDPPLVYLLAGLFLPAAASLFRLTTGPSLAVALGGVATAAIATFAPALMPLLERQPSGPGIGGLVFAVVANLAAWAGGEALTRRELRQFTARWRHDSQRERERSHLRRELADARTLQLAMLPRDPPRLAWAELAGVSLPAAEVGGDYFDYLVLDPERVVLVVGDVAGHGVASGLMLSGLRSCLRLLRGALDTPSGVLERLNEVVLEAMEPRLLVTLAIACVDHRSGEVRVAAAGHPPALLCRQGQAPRELGDPAPPLGTRLPARFRDVVVPLAVGDLLVLYSDGLPEARNGRGEEYGLERLLRDVGRAGAGATAWSVRNALLDGVSGHKGDAVQEDDLTVVVLRYRG